MDVLEQIANWLWFICYVLGVLFVLFGLADTAILALSRKAANALKLAVLVTVIGVIAATFVGVSFGYNYHSRQGDARVAVNTIVFASGTLALLLFGYFRAFRLFVKE